MSKTDFAHRYHAICCGKSPTSWNRIVLTVCEVDGPYPKLRTPVSVVHRSGYTSCSSVVECFCGDKAPVWRTSDLYCDLPCEESSDPNCGGWGFMTVFQIGEPVIRKSLPAPAPTPTHGQVAGSHAKGCFEDTKEARVLGGHSFSSDSMTAQVRSYLLYVRPMK